MNDQEFEQAVHQDPWSDDPAFRAALSDHPDRQALAESLQQQDRLLKVRPPEGLKDRLLSIPREQNENPATGASSSAVERRNPSLRSGILPLAASFLLVVSAALHFLGGGPVSSSAPPNAEMAEFSQAVLNHLYSELRLLTPDSENQFDLETVNTHLAAIGMQLEVNGETRSLEITNLKDCQVARSKGLHLVVSSPHGPISVLMLSNPPVNDEFPIDDERFHGIVVPTQRGNLVIVSERQPDPDARDLQNLFAGNMR